MKQDIKLVILIIAILFFLPIFAFCETEGEENIPDWAKRIEYSVQLETDKNPTFYFQMVQPLYQDADKINTFFIQPRINVRLQRTSYNLGFGYRRLWSENLILGGNLFFDYQDMHSHGRAGFGLEALGQVFEARLNTYIGGLTAKRTLKSVTSGDTIQRVADGFDAEIGAPLPYLPWLKLYGKYFWYDFKNADDKFGWRTRLEAKLNDAIRLEFYSWDDNKGELEYGGRIRFNVAFDTFLDFKDAFKLSEQPFPEKDLKEELLIPVEREFDITVEEWKDTGGLIVEAGRS